MGSTTRRTASTALAGCRVAASPVLAASTSLRRTVREYDAKKLRGDLLAGLTVAMVAIPQSMAFASIAGVPPIYGVYTAIVGAIVGAFFTSSRFLALGPTNTMSLLVSSGFVALAVTEERHVEVAVMLTVFAGAIQVLFALARMGELVRFVSHSVIVGFSAGAGVLIAVGQLPAFLGIDLAHTASGYQGVGEKIDRIAMAISLNGEAVDHRPIAVGLASLAVALICRRISKWLPAYLLAVVVGGLIVYFCEWGQDDLKLVGDLGRGLPEFALPSFSWDQYRPLFAPAVAIALVGMLDAYGIGKKFAAQTGERIDANQEFLCVGVTNLVAGFFRCIPSTGSYSRSALNHAAGAATRFAGLFGGVFVGLIFVLLAPAAKFIPMASIAAILFVIAYGLIDLKYVKRIAKSNSADLLICVGTFVATLTVSLEIAVFVGVFLTIALYLQRARQLYITEMVRQPGMAAGFIERPLQRERPHSLCPELGDDEQPSDQDTNDRGIVFLQVEGNLFFAAADDLQDRFNDLLANDAVRAVILRLKRTHTLDATIMHVIEQFNKQMRIRGRHLILCGLRPRMYDRMESFGLIGELTAENVFISENEPFSAAKRAVERARELVSAEGQPPHPGDATA